MNIQQNTIEKENNVVRTTHNAAQGARIKLVLLIDVLESITGGAERQIYELAKQLDGEKFKVSLFVIHWDKIPEDFKSLSIEAKALGIRRVYGIKGIAEGFKFARFLKNEKVDLVMTYHFSSDIWGTVFAKIAGVKTIISNRRDIGFWRKGIHVFAYKVINRWVSVIMGNSRAVVKMAQEEEGVAQNKTRLFYNGIDLERFNLNANRRRLHADIRPSISSGDSSRNTSEARCRYLKLPEDCRIVGCLGNLKAIKGHNFLIEAAEEVIKNNPDVHFVFIGDDEWNGVPAEQVRQLGLEANVHFLGKRNDVPELLAQMDICVLPSLSEGFSNALLEYMAAGKPIVATAVGGNVDVIEHEKNGLLVPAKDSKALAEAILRLLKDKNFAEQLALNARKTVEERFDMKRQIREFEEFLFSVCGKRDAVCVDAQRTPQNRQAVCGMRSAVCAERITHNAERTMKVLHLISSNGLFGAEKVLLELVRQQIKQGMALCVGVFNNKHNSHLEIADELKKLGIEVVIFDCAGRFDFRAIAEMRKFIKERAIDIIHSHGYKSNFYAWLSTWFLNTKRVATCHGRTEKPGVRAYQLFDAFVLSRFQKAVVVSEVLREKLMKSRIKADKLVLISNGIDINTFADSRSQEAASALRQELKLSPHSKVIGIIGRLSPEKGHHYLFKALLDIRRRLPDVKCLVVGGGELTGELKTQVSDLGLNNYVVFTGVRNDIPEILNILDVFVMPSLTEGMPIALLEAMAAKVPVIATRVGAIPAVIDNAQTGIIVEPKDVQGLSNALIDVLSDKNKSALLAQNGFKKVTEEFSSQKMAKEYFDLYAKVLHKEKQTQRSGIGIIWQGVYPWDVRLEKFINTLSKSFRVTVISKGNDSLSLMEEQDNVTLYRVCYARKLSRTFLRKLVKIINAPIPFNPLWVIRCSTVLRKQAVSLIIVRDLPLMWLGIIVGRLLGVPVVFDMAENYPAALLAYSKRCYKPFLINNAFLPRLYEKIAVAMADHILVVTQEQKTRLIGIGIPATKVSLVSNTPVVGEFHLDKVLDRPSEAKTILYTGKIDAHRGAEVAVRAFAKIVEKFPDARLILAGSGTEEEKLKELAQELGVKDHVSFLGWISHKDIYENIRKSTVCIIPHLKSEHTDTTLPNKLFDYMSLGKPVISSDLSPVVRIIEDYKCGLIFKSGDADSLSEQISQILSNHTATQFGRNGQMAVLDRYNWTVDSAMLDGAVKGLIDAQRN